MGEQFPNSSKMLEKRAFESGSTKLLAMFVLYMITFLFQQAVVLLVFSII